MQLQPTLFGGITLVREWGRIGQAGACRYDHYRTADAARSALYAMYRSKLRRGYAATEIGDSRFELPDRMSGGPEMNAVSYFCKMPDTWAGKTLSSNSLNEWAKEVLNLAVG
jgi:predicted DNA-binding WGR domain protein